VADVVGARLTRRDITFGVMLGHVASAPAWPDTRAKPATPLVALEQAVLPALRRPPCVVSFSGGLDSSLILAVAVAVARREGLPDPVPVTWRFTDAPRADESSWQDLVIRALKIDSWQILRAEDDLDIVGPIARRLLNRHGPLHPVNVHLHLPISEMATGGSLLTGAGGDQILAGRGRPAATSSSAARRIARRVRKASRLAHPVDEPFPWLHREVSQELRRCYRAERRHEPRCLCHRVAWHTSRRDLATTCSSLELIARDHDVALANPLLDNNFLAALTTHAGCTWSPTRNEILAEIAGHAVPAVVIAPRPKARFLEVFLRDPTKQFVRDWNGAGIDEDLVDGVALRELWSKWPIPPGTAPLVQYVWWVTGGSGSVLPRGAVVPPAATKGPR
jgi:hypothetical protein